MVFIVLCCWSPHSSCCYNVYLLKCTPILLSPWGVLCCVISRHTRSAFSASCFAGARFRFDVFCSVVFLRRRRTYNRWRIVLLHLFTGRVGSLLHYSRGFVNALYWILRVVLILVRHYFLLGVDVKSEEIRIASSSDTASNRTFSTTGVPLPVRPRHNLHNSPPFSSLARHDMG